MDFLRSEVDRIGTLQQNNRTYIKELEAKVIKLEQKLKEREMKIVENEQLEENK